MNNKQRLYEIQISANGESFLLTKETHSPFVKSDVFAMAGYKRTLVTLMGTEGMVLQGGKLFFDCKLTNDTQAIMQKSPFSITKDFLDFTKPEIKEPTFFDKVFGFFKREAVADAKLPSSSFVCLQDDGNYHFIGCLSESSHAVNFDVLPLENQVVAKIGSDSMVCSRDSVIFDIIEIEGSKEQIIDTYFSLVKQLYKSEPKSSPQLDVASFSLGEIQEESTLSALASAGDYTLAILEGENGNNSISSYIQQSEAPLRTLLKNSDEKILPIAVISPLVCEKDSTEYELFSGDLLKNAKGKPVTATVSGKEVYIFDIYSKSIRGYLTRQLDILFSMGFCGVKFLSLDLALSNKLNKSAGETSEFCYDFLSRCVGEKFSLACNPHVLNALGKFDFFPVGKNIEKIIGTTAGITHISWDFSGFENAISCFDVNKKFPSTLPIAVPCELLSHDPLLFDLCTACNMLIFKSVNIASPNAEAFERASEFAFLKDADVSEVIEIENGRYAIIFYFEDNANVCFFNFTTSEWVMDDLVIPALSFNFKE